MAGKIKQFCIKGHSIVLSGRNKQGHCKECRRDTNLELRRKGRDFVYRLKNKPCADCFGWFNPWQMQFDHLENKEFNIAIGNTYKRI